MILRPFLNNHPLIVLLLLPLIGVFQWLNGYFHFHTFLNEIEMGLWGKTTWFSLGWSSIISSLVIFLNAVQINVLFNRHEFLDRNIYAPSLFYVVLMSFSHSFYQPDAVLVTHVILIQVLRMLFELKVGENLERIYFNSAFLIGLAASFLPACGFFVIPLWIACWILQPFTFRIWLMMGVGFITPIFNGLMYWWMSGHFISVRILRHSTFIQYESIFYYATAIAIAILFLLSIIGIRIRVRISNIRFKKLNRSLVWILLSTLVLGTFELVRYKQGEWMSFLFIPLSFFFTYAFIHKIWKKVATIFFYLTLVMAFVKFFLFSFVVV